MTYKGNWNSIKGVAPRKGVIRKVFSGANCMMTLNEIRPEAKPALHSHPHEQLSYILHGKAEFVLGDQVFRLEEGDVVFVPPNIEHSLKVIGDEPVLNLDVFSPIREDYLD